MNFFIFVIAVTTVAVNGWPWPFHSGEVEEVIHKVNTTLGNFLNNTEIGGETLAKLCGLRSDNNEYLTKLCTGEVTPETPAFSEVDVAVAHAQFKESALAHMSEVL